MNAMNGVEAISTDQLKQRMLEGQGGREMQTSSCCIASPIASCTVLYQADGCWCFYHFLYVSMFFIWIPSLSADLCYLVDMVLRYKIHRASGKFLECSRRCKKRCNCRGLPDCSGVELNFARRILLWNVSRSASACLCNRQTDAWFFVCFCAK